MRNLFITVTVLTVFLFVSCSSDDASIFLHDNIEAPATYTFIRDGESTVAFGGQTTRILMATETVSAFTDFDNNTEASLLAMYNHQAGVADFSDENLNVSDKNLRSKSAASYDYFAANASESTQIKATFDGYISSQMNEVFINRMTLASPGIAGQIADGTRTRYVNAKGLEYDQSFAKGILGALMADQMLNNYLSAAVLDEGESRQNNDNGISQENKPYTTMEHKWDEAYGYLYGTSTNPENPNLTIGEDDKFLNEYVGRVNDNGHFATIAADIWDAFKLGRAAIVAKKYQVRDAQAAIIREKVSTVIAARGIFYLQQGKNKIVDGDREGAFHALSEAYGFVYSLRFTRKSESATPLFTRTDVDTLLGMLMSSSDHGYWDISPETLDLVSEAMAAKFNFTVAQAANN